MLTVDEVSLETTNQKHDINLDFAVVEPTSEIPAFLSRHRAHKSDPGASLPPTVLSHDSLYFPYVPCAGASRKCYCYHVYQRTIEGAREAS